MVKSRLQTTDYGQTESDAYEPTVQNAQVGSKILIKFYEKKADSIGFRV